MLGRFYAAHGCDGRMTKQNAAVHAVLDVMRRAVKSPRLSTADCPISTAQHKSASHMHVKQLFSNNMQRNIEH